MLTIDDIKNVGFRRAKFGGYKPEDVDAFIDDVQISFEKMAREIRNLNNQVRKFMEEDKSIKSVISSAKQVAEQSIDDARNHTTNMLSEAAKKSEDMINSAKREVEINKEISERLKSESANLKQKLDDIYKKHLQIISEIPADIFAAASAENVGVESSVKNEEGKSSADINRQNNSNARTRFFEIDANAAKESGARARFVASSAHNGKNDEVVFGSEGKTDKRSKNKFENLQFGKNFNIAGSGKDISSGAYSGIFKK